jgi:DNA ligase-1
MKNFKPLLAPNETIDLDSLKYPLIATFKIDGIRMVVTDGQLLSRSLKPIMNKAIKNRFNFLVEYSTEHGILFDGELYTPSLNFPELSGQVRGYDNEIVDDLSFYCFDLLCNAGMLSYKLRLELAKTHIQNLNNYIKFVPIKIVNNKKEIKNYFNKALSEGFEGLILRNPEGRYKFGKATINENIIFKMKPFQTFDAKIIGVEQATEVRKGAEKKINELGYSVTSKKKNDRELIEKASAFIVKYKNKELKVTLAMTDEEKKEIWKNYKNYIGKTIEYKGMLIGVKDLPRHPVFIRFRPDKDN